MTLTRRVQSTKKAAGTVALGVRLDSAGEEAFTRLSKSLPTIADALTEISGEMRLLGSDLVVIGKDANFNAIETLAEAVEQLMLVSGQINDSDTQKRIQSLVDRCKALLEVPQGKADLSTGDLTSDGGALQPAQGKRYKVVAIDESKFAVVDTVTGRQVSTHDSREKADSAAASRNATNKGLSFVFLSKADESEKEERTVFGVVLAPEEIDLQDDIYSPQEVRKTAWRFMEEYQQFGLMHKTIGVNVRVLESYLAPVAFEVKGEVVKKGSWLLRVRVLDDKIWAKVKSGELTGFSIGGSAIRTPETVEVVA